MARDDASEHLDAPTWMRQRLRAGLAAAMKARDQVRVQALRAGLGAIDNAESVVVADESTSSPSSRQSGGIAGASSGLGASEATRRALTAEDVADVIRRQIDERLAAADEIERAGVPERASLLRSEAEVLAAFLDE